MSLNNVIPAWMLDEKNNKWYIEYTDGSRIEFMCRDKKSAHRRFMMEGDHAHTYGRVHQDEQ